MKSLALHIGPQKTGSTYLQKRLYEARGTLLENDILYPSDVSIYGHHEAAMSYFPGVKIRPSISSLVDAASKHRVIVSSELFSLVPHAGLLKLHDEIGSQDVTLIYFLRNPSERLFSLWSEWVRHGERISFFELATKEFSGIRDSTWLNPVPTLKAYADVFGKSRLRIVNYENARASVSMLDRFFAAAGLPSVLEDHDEDVNPPSSVEQVELIRVLNQLAFVDGWLDESNVRALFTERLAQDSECRLSTLVRDAESLIKQSVTTVVIGGLDIDREIADEVTRQFGGELDDPEFSWRQRKVNLPASSWLMDRQAMECVSEIYAQLRE